MRVLITERTCRLCTHKGLNYKPIFDKDDRIKRMIKCLPIQIRANDDLPHHMCPSCIEALEVTFNLNILCLKAHLKLLHQSRKRHVQQPMPSPKSHTSTKSYRRTNELEINASTSLANRSPTNSSRHSDKVSGYNWSNVFRKVPEVRLNKLPENILEKANTSENSIVSVKEEMLDPDVLKAADIEQCKPIKRRPGRPRKIRREIRSLSPGTSRCLSKDEEITQSLITVKTELESTVPKQMPVIPALFKYSHELTHDMEKCIINKGIAVTYSNCENGNMEKESEKPRAKRSGVSNEDDDVEEYFSHPRDRGCTLLPRKCKLYDVNDTEKKVVKVKKVTKKREIKKDLHQLYECQHCDHKYTSRRGLDNHIQRFHIPPETWKHICTMCTARFANKYDLSHHQSKCNGIRRTIKCPLCILHFQHESHMEKHFQARHAKTIKKEL